MNIHIGLNCYIHFKKEINLEWKKHACFSPLRSIDHFDSENFYLRVEYTSANYEEYLAFLREKILPKEIEIEIINKDFSECLLVKKYDDLALNHVRLNTVGEKILIPLLDFKIHINTDSPYVKYYATNYALRLLRFLSLVENYYYADYSDDKVTYVVKIDEDLFNYKKEDSFLKKGHAIYYRSFNNTINKEREEFINNFGLSTILKSIFELNVEEAYLKSHIIVESEYLDWVIKNWKTCYQST
jgi:hypothetical protein